ncbi:MAG: Asp/Glu/hydantoin racemase, partial [Microbacterium sp.]|uniref:aspartate/glutamate racemase family protein n=1 Tax=Microbacterium sp. TaxID=51671 RepID=UPI00261049D6
MKILVVNCNTSVEVSHRIAVGARAAAAPGTQIVMAEPSWGVSSAEGYYESFISAAAVLSVLVERGDEADAVVLAGFGEHGREGARQLLDAPVVDITEAAAITAGLLGHRYGVVTTLRSTVAGIEDSLLTAGLDRRCAGVRAADIPVLAIHEELEATARALAVEARVLIEAGADVIVLGCAGMAGLDLALESLLDVPVVDGVQAAVGLAESLVRMGKRTSKR